MGNLFDDIGRIGKIAEDLQRLGEELSDPSSQVPSLGGGALDAERRERAKGPAIKYDLSSGMFIKGGSAGEGNNTPFNKLANTGRSTNPEDHPDYVLIDPQVETPADVSTTDVPAADSTTTPAETPGTETNLSDLLVEAPVATPAESVIEEPNADVSVEAPIEETNVDVSVEAPVATSADVSTTDVPAADSTTTLAETPETERSLSARLASIISDYHLEDERYYRDEEVRALATKISGLASQLDSLDDTRKAMASELISMWHRKMALSQTDELVGGVHEALIVGLEGILHSDVENLTAEQIKERLASNLEINRAKETLAYPQAGDYLERVLKSYRLIDDDAGYDQAAKDTGAALLSLAAEIKSLAADTQKTLENEIYAWHSAMAENQTSENVLTQNNNLLTKLRSLIDNAAAQTSEAANAEEAAVETPEAANAEELVAEEAANAEEAVAETSGPVEENAALDTDTADTAAASADSGTGELE